MEAAEAVKPTTLKIRLSLSSKNGKGKKSEKEDQKVVEAPVPEKRKRAPEHFGMQPKQIFTGFYSDSNKRLKKTVFNGMLRVPPFTTALVKDAIKNVESNGFTGLDSKFNLPDVQEMLRPSLDPALASSFLITSLRAGNAGTTRVTSGPLTSIVGGKRIRGGGEGDVPMEDVSQPVLEQQQPPLPQQNPTAPESVKVSPPNPVQLEVQARNPVVPQPMEVANSSQPQSKKKEEKPLVPQPMEVSVVNPAKDVSASARNIAPVAKPVAPLPQAPVIHARAIPQAPATPLRAPLYTMPKSPIMPLETASVNVPQLSVQQPNTNANTKSPAPVPVPSTDTKKADVTNNVAVIKPLPPTTAAVKEKKPLSGEQEKTIELPSWYNAKTVSGFEKSLLPEWFNNSSDHRTESSYIVARGRILDVARRSSNKYLTSTAVRRCVVGDAGSIVRLHEFLVTWGFINGSAIGDNAPLQVISEVSSPTSEVKWTLQMSDLLGVAVTNFSKKKKLEGDVIERLEIDWESISEQVGGGVSPSECYQKFLSTDFSEIGGNGDKVKVANVSPCKDEATREDLIADLIDGVKPSVAKAVVDAALIATDADISTAQKAAVLGAISSKAVERAREEEASTSRILQEILDLRMARLENRLSLLDDLEGMLDAERMALELERRDLYTNRCRFWFNSDSA